jgi:cystathionine beta-lyase
LSHNYDEPINRRGRGSLKWDTYPEDVLPLWVADMDFPAPEAVIHALRRAVEHGIFGYPAEIHALPGERNDMREVIVERMKRLYQWAIQPEDILFIPGVVIGLNLVVHALAEAGGEVIVQPPVYPPILRAPQYGSLKRVDVELLARQSAPTSPEFRYEVDEEAFQAAFSPQTRLFILCNPQNPTGRVFRQDELQRLAEVCLSRKALICSDEIHNDLIYPPHRHIPIATLDAQVANNTITLMAPSKTFNIPGLQFAFAIVPNAELRQKLHHASRGLLNWINLLAWEAAYAAYQQGEVWLQNTLAYLQSNRDMLTAWLQANLPKVRYTCPEGTYLTWLDFRQMGLPENPYEFFLKNARVALNDGETFGAGGQGFVRLNFACPRSTLLEALRRMKEACDPYS